MTARSVLTGLALLFALAAPGPALSQDQSTNSTAPKCTLDTITVTADKREQSIQDVPASIAAMTGDQMETYGVRDTSDIFARVPNLHLVRTGPHGEGYASMRGIAGFMGGNPAIGFYVDDVYYPSFGLNLFDIERYEVLRGPQGTLYGRNTEAGVINVVTRQATNEWSSKFTLGLASHNTPGIEGLLNGPLVEDKLFMRAAARYQSSDGYFTNEFDDDNSVDQSRDADGRFNLRWLPTSRLDLSLTADVQSYRGNYAEFSPLDNFDDDPYRVNTDWPGKADKDAGGLSLRASYDMDAVQILSITAARNENSEFDNDIDFTPMDLMRLDVVKDDTFISQELRLLSNDRESPLQWLVGAYLFHEHVDGSTTMTFGPMTGMEGDSIFNSNTKTLGTALFAQSSYTFFEKLELTLGLRYDRESKDFDYNTDGTGAFASPSAHDSGSSDKTYDAWLPKASLSYRVTDNLMPYASVSRGFKSGGFNTNTDAGKPYDSEYTWSYEAGIKSEWLDNRLQVNLAAFYIQWSDLQVEQPNYPDYTIDNAGSAESRGFEAEIKAYPLDGLEILGAFGLTKAKYTEYDYGSVDMAGKKIASIPEASAQLGATYRFAGGLFVNADYIYTGSHYFDAMNTRKQGGYQTLNAKVGYEDETYELSLWAKNLTNTVYATRAFVMNNTWYGRAGDPLTFGLSGSIRF